MSKCLSQGCKFIMSVCLDVMVPRANDLSLMKACSAHGALKSWKFSYFMPTRVCYAGGTDIYFTAVSC